MMTSIIHWHTPRQGVYIARIMKSTRQRSVRIPPTTMSITTPHGIEGGFPPRQWSIHRQSIETFLVQPSQDLIEGRVRCYYRASIVIAIAVAHGHCYSGSGWFHYTIARLMFLLHHHHPILLLVVNYCSRFMLIKRRSRSRHDATTSLHPSRRQCRHGSIRTNANSTKTRLVLCQTRLLFRHGAVTIVHEEDGPQIIIIATTTTTLGVGG
mmetsp:Transcript_2210/g.4706  ORF Transcript_2210/g.4706 Transcript_2210/m.4706 type:complete len:210 (+) Transcript_2210:613-1242(+)